MYCPLCSTSFPAHGALTDEQECPHCDATFVMSTPKKDTKLIRMFDAMRSGKKIEAIKQYRSLFDTNLVDSKNAVERIMDRIGY